MGILSLLRLIVLSVVENVVIVIHLLIPFRSDEELFLYFNIRNKKHSVAVEISYKHAKHLKNKALRLNIFDRFYNELQLV